MKCSAKAAFVCSGLLFALAAVNCRSFAQIVAVSIAPHPITLPLWPDAVPENTEALTDRPEITVYLPAKAEKLSPAVVLCPGGGYAGVNLDYEGMRPARWFQERGVAAIVLRYRIPLKGYRYPVPFIDAQRAVRLVRSRAGEWSIDPAKVGILGFSAGGHLAATLATHFDAGDPASPDLVERQSCRPGFAILVYPVITLKGPYANAGSRTNLLGSKPDPSLIDELSDEAHVTVSTPPTLLIHASDDVAVSVENSRMMYAALRKAGVPSELQEYPSGGHGFSFGVLAPAGWMDRMAGWLRSQHMMP